MNNDLLKSFIISAIQEDIGDGDHSALSCIPETATGKAKLLIKQQGVLAGIEIAKKTFQIIDSDLKLTQSKNDGEEIFPGDIVLEVKGKVQSILKAERLILNIMQRMSGIATTTHSYVKKIEDLNCKILDTRKTTPVNRHIEKLAVKIGGGENHRMGLYDMIMLKDNHIDFAGSIEAAIERANQYRQKLDKELKIVIETRNLDEIKQVLSKGGVDRIMLDNFSITETKEAVDYINKRIPIESSGGITLETIRQYAECGVDYISVGALTHQIQSLDMSLKADF